jgi:hypothetical protein
VRPSGLGPYLLAVAALALAVLGCDPAGTPGVQYGLDGSPGDPDARPPPPAPDATPACEDLATPNPNGYHTPSGYDFEQGSAGCMGQCHPGPGGDIGPAWTIGGSVWNHRTPGGSAVAGAIVYVIDGQGTVVRMTTDQNGYFWSNQPVTQPLRAYATACPDSLGMEANTDGNCNRNGCHAQDTKIYLPGQL